MALTITWYGHSTFGIDADGTKIIVDPFLKPNNPAAPVSAGEVEADFILVTHGHGDHVADLVPLAKRTGAHPSWLQMLDRLAETIAKVDNPSARSALVAGSQ